MDTATVILEGECQTVRLPEGIHLPATVFVRPKGSTVVLEPIEAQVWPGGFLIPPTSRTRRSSVQFRVNFHP